MFKNPKIIETFLSLYTKQLGSKKIINLWGRSNDPFTESIPNSKYSKILCFNERDCDNLEKKYPKEEGYKVQEEQYLRDKDGNIVKDEKTGEARRIDFVVIKDGKVVKSVEVTSRKAPKQAQSSKEGRIRDQGGNYVKDKETGEIVPFEKGVKTEIDRRA